MAVNPIRTLTVLIDYAVKKASLVDVERQTDEVKKSLGEAADRALTFGTRLRDAAKRATPALNKMGDALKAIDQRANEGAKRLVQAGAAAGTGLIVGAVAATAQSERLNAQLETVTGSADAASAQLDRLGVFTSDIALTTSEAAQGFIKLSNLGLDPSERALLSYGNTAAAMGKDLDQLVEAVADASVGEFERLKEFGIKASSEGDKVALTFRGQTTKIGKNAKEIQEFLIGIGETQFAGVLERQVDTLDSQFAKARERTANFLTIVGEAGLAGGIKRLNARIAELSQGSGSLAERIGVGLGRALDALITAINWAAENTDTLRRVAIALGVAFAGLKVLRFAGAFVTLATGIVEAVKAIELMVSAARFLAIGTGPLFLKIALVTTAIVSLVEAFRFLTGQGGLVQDFVDRFATADGILGDIARTLQEVKAELGPIVKELLRDLTEQGQDLAKSILPVLVEVAGALIETAKALGPILVDWVKRFLAVHSTMRAVLFPLVKFVIRLGLWMFKIQAQIVAFVARVAPLAARLQGVLLRFFLPIQQVFDSLRVVFDQIKEGVADLIDFVAPVFEKISDLGGKIFDRVEQAFEKFLDTIRKIIRRVASVVDLPEEVLEFAGIVDEQKAKGEAERGRLGTGRERAREAAEELLRIRAQREALTANVGTVNIQLQGQITDKAGLVDATRKAGEEFGAGMLAAEFRNVQPAEQ